MGKRKWQHITSVNGNPIRLYTLYKNMLARCYSKNHHKYKNYGGRGITVCEEWLNSWDNFAEWAYANGYSDDLTIDRINVNGNYEPSNCRWTNAVVQARNKTNNLVIEGKTIAEIAEQYGINFCTLSYRFKSGKYETIEDLVSNIHKYTYVDGLSMYAISKKYNVPYSTIRGRYDAGARTLSELLTRRG